MKRLFKKVAKPMKKCMIIYKVFKNCISKISCSQTYNKLRKVSKSLLSMCRKPIQSSYCPKNTLRKPDSEILGETKEIPQIQRKAKKNPADGKKSHQGFGPQFVTTASERYQDRWKWFLQASRSSLNPPGPRGKAKNLFYRTRQFIEKIKKCIIILIITP